MNKNIFLFFLLFTINTNTTHSMDGYVFGLTIQWFTGFTGNDFVNFERELERIDRNQQTIVREQQTLHEARLTQMPQKQTPHETPLGQQDHGVHAPSHHHHHTIEQLYQDTLKKFVENTKKKFIEQIIPYYAEHLKRNNHTLTIVWDIDETLLSSENVLGAIVLDDGTQIRTFRAIPEMRELFKWCQKHGFNNVFVSGRFNQLHHGKKYTDAVVHATLHNLMEEGYSAQIDNIHCLPFDRYHHIPTEYLAEHVVVHKTIVREALVKKGMIIVATFDDLFINLFCRITQQSLPHIGEPFHVPSKRFLLQQNLLEKKQ